MRCALAISLIIVISSINMVTSESNTTLDTEIESTIISDYSRAIQLAFERVSDLERYDDWTLRETTDWVVVTRIPHEYHYSMFGNYC